MIRARALVPFLAALLVAASCASTRSAAPAAPRSSAATGPEQLEATETSGRYGLEPTIVLSALEAALLADLRSRRPLHASGALSLAARALARGVAAGVADPTAPGRIRTALARGFAFDPSPRVFRVDATPSTGVPALTASIELEPGDSHVGVGVARTSDRVHVIVLVSSRLATLEGFPREASPGERVTLRGRLTALSRPSVHLTSPAGDSHTERVHTEAGRFEAPLLFDRAGRWTVEVVGEGARGPQVAALLTVACGGAALDSPPATDSPDPEDARAAEARVIAAIGATRARQAVAPLQASPALSDVARLHAEAMLRAGVLAHRLDGQTGAGDRLRRARVPFSIVLENVARGSSAIAAHRLAEESPAHRQNILSPEVTRVGVGIARGTLPGGERVVYLTELFTAVAADLDQDPLTPEARVREAIWRERARLGASPLVSDPRLDDLARAAVRAMLRRGEPDPGDLPQQALSAGRQVAAADAFVASRAGDAARSRNVGDARFNRVGVSVATGNDARYGAGQLWIAVIYTD